MDSSGNIAPDRRRFSLERIFALTGTRTGVLGLTSVGNLVVRTGSSMLLTRLLTPDDFGIVGIISAIFFAVAMLTDLGFEQFIVRHERSEEQYFLNVIWTLHVKRGVLSFIALAVASPLIAEAFGKSILTMPLAVASLYFLINGFTSLSLSTALRHDKARQLSLFDFGLQLIQTASGLVLAWWWRSVWAIIAGILIHMTARVLLSYRLFPGHSRKLARDRKISREFFAFSRVILLSSLLTLMIGQMDKLILGRLFTLSEFGLYSLALTIASAPTSFADSYLRRIAFPVYAQSWREYPAALPGLYYGVRRLPSLLYAFACGGLIGAAPFLVALLYDPRYAAAAPLISWLMLATALRLPTFAAAELLTAVGQVEGTLHLNVVRVLWLAASIPTGYAYFGAMGIVAAVSLVEAPTLLFSWVLLRRHETLKLREEFLYLTSVAVGALTGLACSTELLQLFPHL